MNDEMNFQNVPFVLSEVDIPFGERLSIAIQKFFTSLANALICLFLAPIIFGRTLFTTKRKVYQAAPFLGHSQMLPNNGPPGEMTINLKPMMPESEEKWKQAHDDIYNNNDEEDN